MSKGGVGVFLIILFSTHVVVVVSFCYSNIFCLYKYVYTQSDPSCLSLSITSFSSE